MNEENSRIQAQHRLLKIYGVDNHYNTVLIQSAMLTNGGAAIALLAFIGSIWSKGLDSRSLQLLSASLAFFSSGVGLALTSLFFCYFRSCVHIDNYSSNTNQAEQDFRVKICKNLKIKASVILGAFWVIILTSLVVSYAFFMYGIHSAIDTFYTHLSFVAGADFGST